jgi:tripartite-type tricarboxylate transporter receptor subunit TctC
VGEELSAAIGQPVVVENRPGAGGHLGGAAAASSKPDGYTISICGFLTHSVGPLLFKDLSYDPMKDLPPLTTLAISPNVLVARKSLGVNSLDELIALAKEQPGKLTYSSGGIGSTGHISGELVKQMAGVDITHVAYKNSPDSVNAVTTGEVDFTFFTVPGLSAAIKDGNVVPLAVTSKTRSNAFPDVPTLDESGFAGFDISAWFALCAPAGLPDDVAGRLQSELSNVLENDEMKSKIEGLGMQPHFLNMADTISMAQDEINRLTPVVEKLLSQN